MKVMFYGDADNAPKEENMQALSENLFECDLLLTLLQSMAKLEFEARKDIAFIYNFLLRNRKDEAVAYVKNHPNLILELANGYSSSEIALNSGSILREALRHEDICSMVLANTPLMETFFTYLQLPTFDVSSDAFTTLKVLLTKHKKIACKFLETNFDSFFANYSKLLSSDSYVTKRLALKLLAELLLSRENFTVMMKFINKPEHLKLIMNLLRGTTKSIQLEAFHVFKIFVANPKKTDAIREILYRNRSKLMDFLSRFQKDKEDEQFNDERNILLQTLQSLEPPPGFVAQTQQQGVAPASAVTSTTTSSAQAPVPERGPPQ